MALQALGQKAVGSEVGGTVSLGTRQAVPRMHRKPRLINNCLLLRHVPTEIWSPKQIKHSVC